MLSWIDTRHATRVLGLIIVLYDIYELARRDFILAEKVPSQTLAEAVPLIPDVVGDGEVSTDLIPPDVGYWDFSSVHDSSRGSRDLYGPAAGRNRDRAWGSEVADMYPACLIGSRAVALMGIRAHHWSH